MLLSQRGSDGVLGVLLAAYNQIEQFNSANDDRFSILGYTMSRAVVVSERFIPGRAANP